jgi:hypothetical protein
MEIREYLCVQIGTIKKGLSRVLEGLTETEIAWRPGPQSNSIGLIFFHLARSIDNMVNGDILKKTTVWESEKWYEKLKMPTQESGARYTSEQIIAFSPPPLKDLRAYYDAVEANTLSCVQNLALEKLDRKVTLPFGEFTVGALFALIMGHAYQHIGEMSYIRGLQRGLNK